MKLKLFFALIGSQVCISAFAVTNSNFDGYYVGVRGGDIVTQANLQNYSFANFVTLYDTDVLSTAQSNTVSNNSIVGNIFVGYGKVLQNTSIYLGGEFFAEFANPSVDMQQSAFHISPNDDQDAETLTTRTETRLGKVGFGVDFRPGVVLDANTLVYGRVGLAFNRENIDSRTQFNYDDIIGGNIITPNTLVASHARNTMGIRLGLGAEHRISDRFAVIIDYVYTDYGKINTYAAGDIFNTVDGTPFIVSNGFTNTASGTMNTQVVMLGLKYNLS